MQWQILIVNLDKEIKIEKKCNFSLPTIYVDNLSEAQFYMNTGDIVFLCLFAKKYTYEIEIIILDFMKNCAYLPDHILIVCDSFVSNFLINTYEYYIEQYSSVDLWHIHVDEKIKNILPELRNFSSPTSKLIQLGRNILTGQNSSIETSLNKILDEKEWNYIICFNCARAYAALAKWQKSLDLCESLLNKNKFFRPAFTLMAEVYLAIGNFQQAISIFEKLERNNDKCLKRKIDLSIAYREIHNSQKADQLYGEAKHIAESAPKVIEAQAYMLLIKGNYEESIKLMDGLDEIEPFFAEKINEIGIELAKSRQLKISLTLYAKAHQLARENLKFKFSLNSAIACWRANQYNEALHYLNRCRIEYGGSFAALEKIESNIKQKLVRDGI